MNKFTIFTLSLFLIISCNQGYNYEMNKELYETLDNTIEILTRENFMNLQKAKKDGMDEDEYNPLYLALNRIDSATNIVLNSLNTDSNYFKETEPNIIDKKFTDLLKKALILYIQETDSLISKEPSFMKLSTLSKSNNKGQINDNNYLLETRKLQLDLLFLDRDVKNILYGKYSFCGGNIKYGPTIVSFKWEVKVKDTFKAVIAYYCKGYEMPISFNLKYYIIDGKKVNVFPEKKVEIKHGIGIINIPVSKPGNYRYFANSITQNCSGKTDTSEYMIQFKAIK